MTRVPGLLSLWVLLNGVVLSAPAADVYTLDTDATRVGFDVEQFGLHWVSAHFRDFSGEFVFDRAGPASRVDVRVQTESVDCGDAHWNPNLRSSEWLDVQHYPHMIYRSRHIAFEGSDRAVADGELTLHGVTRQVSLTVSQLKCGSGPATGSVCRFVAQARVKRSDYGLPHGFWVGGDLVDISISGVGTRAKP